MKKTRVVFALFLTLLILAGCAAPSISPSSSASMPAAPIPAVADNPASITITNQKFFDGADSTQKAEWLTTLGQSAPALNIGSLTLGESAYIETIVDKAKNKSLSGFVYVDNYSDLWKLVDAGVVVPLGQYVKDSEIWAALPENFKAALTANGSVWGIPADGEYVLPWVRSYRAEWLAELDRAIPENTDDLKSLLALLAEHEEAGIYSVNAAGLADIFAAFDAPLSYGGPIGYNEAYSGIVDSMLTDGAKSALSYLRDLYRMGAINSDFLTTNYDELAKVMTKGTAASTYYPLGGAKLNFGATLSKETPYQVYTESAGGLNGKGTPITVKGGAYCLLTNSAQPLETTRYLLKMLWGSESNWLACSVGITGYTKTESGLVLDYADSKYTLIPRPNLCGTLPGMFEAKTYLRFYTDTPAADKELAQVASQHYYTMITEGLANGDFYFRHPLLTGITSATYSEKADAFSTAFVQLLKSAVTDPNTTVENALSIYKQTVGALGGDKVLTEANAALGVYPAQTYIPTAASSASSGTSKAASSALSSSVTSTAASSATSAASPAASSRP
ncbi:MAG TPA: hypothetical protein PKH29_01320 [Oscillospiraceae bacterium]|nr:hypothetical protein [Oscillospiraceae bacterium]